jgi:glucosamine kinase
MTQPTNLPTHIHYLVGVDGGGSSTRARLTLRDGTVLGGGKAGASGLMQGIPQAWQNITLAIERAVQASTPGDRPAPDLHNCALGIGIAGYNHTGWPWYAPSRAVNTSESATKWV